MATPNPTNASNKKLLSYTPLDRGTLANLRPRATKQAPLVYTFPLQHASFLGPRFPVPTHSCAQPANHGTALPNTLGPAATHNQPSLLTQDNIQNIDSANRTMQNKGLAVPETGMPVHKLYTSVATRRIRQPAFAPSDQSLLSSISDYCPLF